MLYRQTVPCFVPRSFTVGSFCAIEMCEIINTAQFRFPPGSPRPSWAEIAIFVKSLETDLLLIETAYKTAKDRSLFLKFSSMDAMMECLRKNAEPRKFVYANGLQVEVRMCIAGANMQYVRVFDLPPELSDECLSSVLRKYGKVEQVIHEKFPADSGLGHIFNGVRGVYIDVECTIPPEIVVGNWKARIFYDGLKDVCFLCRAVGHRRNSCPQRENRKQPAKNQEKEQEPRSYAAVVSADDAVPSSIGKTSEIEIIEVLEDNDQPSNELGVEELVVRESEADSEDEWRPMTQTEKLEEVAKAIKEVMGNPTADQRRAQFAALGSS